MPSRRGMSEEGQDAARPATRLEAGNPKTLTRLGAPRASLLTDAVRCLMEALLPSGGYPLTGARSPSQRDRTHPRDARSGGPAVSPGDEPHVETPERLARQRALRTAVLVDAVRCLMKKPGAGDRDPMARRAALRWIRSFDTLAPFSFHNVCESLGLDSSRVRRVLLTRAFVKGGPSGLAVHRARSPRLGVASMRAASCQRTFSSRRHNS